MYLNWQACYTYVFGRLIAAVGCATIALAHDLFLSDAECERHELTRRVGRRAVLGTEDVDRRAHWWRHRRHAIRAAVGGYCICGGVGDVAQADGIAGLDERCAIVAVGWRSAPPVRKAAGHGENHENELAAMAATAEPSSHRLSTTSHRRFSSELIELNEPTAPTGAHRPVYSTL